MKSPDSTLLQSATALVLLPAVFLTGCSSMSPEMGSELGKDLPGIVSSIGTLATKPTSVGDVMFKGAAVMHLVSTVEKYQRLSQQQRMQVERIAQQRYDRIVEKKKAHLAPTYKAKKSAIASKGLSPEKKEQELAKVDKEWFAAARTDAKKEYGSGFAVPVKNDSGKPVVAFARIDGDKAVAMNDSYVIAKAPESGSTVAHGGNKFTVVPDSIR